MQSLTIGVTLAYANFDEILADIYQSEMLPNTPNAATLNFLRMLHIPAIHRFVRIFNDVQIDSYN